MIEIVKVALRLFTMGSNNNWCSLPWNRLGLLAADEKFTVQHMWSSYFIVSLVVAHKGLYLIKPHVMFNNI